jgi:hypothetical protein
MGKNSLHAANDSEIAYCIGADHYPVQIEPNPEGKVKGTFKVKWTYSDWNRIRVEPPAM